MINDRFGAVAESYHQKAEIPQKVAQGLISSLLPWKEIIPEGPILEVGCGTGFLSELLIQHFPDREFIITDRSSEMLSYCEQRLKNKGIITDEHNIRFEVLDADNFSADEETNALVISNFTPHWFKDPSVSLERLSESILPGGLLLCSFPGNQSFENWYEHCLQLGLPHTAHPLPDVEEVVVKLSMGPMQIDYYENDLYQEFDQAIDFFRYLKETGASFSAKGSHLSYKQLRLLMNHWDEKSTQKVKMKWHVVYVAAKKDAI